MGRSCGRSESHDTWCASYWENLWFETSSRPSSPIPTSRSSSVRVTTRCSAPTRSGPSTGGTGDRDRLRRPRRRRRGRRGRRPSSRRHRAHEDCADRAGRTRRARTPMAPHRRGRVGLPAISTAVAAWLPTRCTGVHRVADVDDETAPGGGAGVQVSWIHRGTTSDAAGKTSPGRTRTLVSAVRAMPCCRVTSRLHPRRRPTRHARLASLHPQGTRGSRGVGLDLRVLRRGRTRRASGVWKSDCGGRGDGHGVRPGPRPTRCGPGSSERSSRRRPETTIAIAIGTAVPPIPTRRRHDAASPNWQAPISADPGPAASGTCPWASAVALP